MFRNKINICYQNTMAEYFNEFLSELDHNLLKKYRIHLYHVNLI